MDAAEFIALRGEDVNEDNAHAFEELANADESQDDEINTQETVRKALSQNEAPTPQIVNIVACADYNVQLDLLKIASSVRNCEYNPKRFPAATLRNMDPKATALAFKNGKVNIVGCRTLELAYKAARCFGRLFKQLGIEGVTIKSFQIANIVARMNCRFPVHLESIAAHPSHIKFSTYNPEIFAGLIYRLASPKATLLIFVSGKVIITGAKTESDVKSAANYIFPILKQFSRIEPVH